jgi:Flp pilus assembly pilin Flp
MLFVPAYIPFRRTYRNVIFIGRHRSDLKPATHGRTLQFRARSDSSATQLSQSGEIGRQVRSMKLLLARIVRSTTGTRNACGSIASMLTSVERGEEGAALVEYALVLALFAVAAMGGLTALGTATSQVLNTFQASLLTYDLRHA